MNEKEPKKIDEILRILFTQNNMQCAFLGGPGLPVSGVGYTKEYCFICFVTCLLQPIPPRTCFCDCCVLADQKLHKLDHNALSEVKSC